MEERTVDCLTGDDPDSVGILLPEPELGIRDDGVVVSSLDCLDDDVAGILDDEETPDLAE